MNQLESALVLALRDTIKWESSVVASDSGTLTPVNADLPFDARVYQERDRQLAYRDLIVGAAVVEVSVQVGDVWNYSTVKPSLQGPVPFALPFVASEAGTYNSKVRHVTNVSIPYDAARYADADLYGRDSLVYEVLARACEDTFVEPSIPVLDSTRTLIPGTKVWSLAEGAPMRADINTALPLNRDLFKNPDRNLADRDNQLAGYAASLVQVLKNPFDHALRLYIQIESYGTIQREPDIYALVQDSGSHRVFQAEPALPGANKIVYDTEHKTLQWVRERIDEVHVPQIYAMAVPGIDFGQTVETVAAVPDGKDAQYWRGKAGMLNPTGIKTSDTELVLDSTNNDAVAGGLMQYSTASFGAPDTIVFDMTGTVTPIAYRVSVLTVPNSTVEIAGVQNISNTSGTLGGATFETNVASGDITDKLYFVVGGDGIVYNTELYLPGDSFAGIDSVPTYTQYGLLASTVRQYSINFSLALPAGAWNVSAEYTNLSGSTDGFGVKALYIATGADPVTIIQDAAPIPFNTTNGNLLVTAQAGIDIKNSSPFTLPVYWTSGDGELHIRKLIFEKTDVATARYAMSGTFAGSVAYADVNGVDKIPDVIRWQFVSNGLYKDSVPLTVKYTDDATLPIQIKQVHVQSLTEYDTTPLSSGFQSWRQECLDRAERVVQQGYYAAIQAYGTDVPTFRDSGSYWTSDATENWMSFAEVYTPRLREVSNIGNTSIIAGRQYEVDTDSIVYDGTTYTNGHKFYGIESSGTVYSGGTVHQVGAFTKSRAGHVGKPALVPRGIYFDDAEKRVKSYYDTIFATPVVMTCQPWMVDCGFYVAQPEFWMPEALGLLPPSIATYEVLISGVVSPLGTATISGLGVYRYGTSVTLTAHPALMPGTGYADIVFIVDESISMDKEQEWLGKPSIPPTAGPYVPSLLEAELVANNIGAGAYTNRYALVGFARAQPSPGANAHAIPVGGTDWGTASDLETAAANLVVTGWNEDGYEAIDFTLKHYNFRPGAVKLLVLITDEERTDITSGNITKASITSALKAEGALLAAVLDLNIKSTGLVSSIGRKGTSVYIESVTHPYYIEGTLGTITGSSTTVEDYCDLVEIIPSAQPDGGSEWDLNILRDGGAHATAFTSAFVNVTKSQITHALSYSFDHWVIDGVTYTTNPVSFTASANLTANLFIV